jgi:Domain of unknown function (DUF4389)
MSNGEEWNANQGGAEGGTGEPPSMGTPPPPEDAPGMGAPPPPPPAGEAPAAPSAATPPAPPSPPPVAAPMPPVAATRMDRGGYPIDLDVEVPDHIARWRPLVQWILAIPLFIILYVLGLVAGVVAFVGWFAALFTGNLPEGFGDFIAGYYRYSWRTYSYYAFLREKYPPFGPSLGYTDSGDDPAWFEVQRGEGLSRLAVLFRIILVIPQAIVIFFLSIALYVAVVLAFFAVIITGKWPTGLRDFLVGGARWIFRVNAWFYLLADPYPPFSLH